MIAASDPSKTIRKEVIKRMKNIGIDISKKKCVVCVMDDKGKILEESAYENTLVDAKEFACRMKKEYGRKGQCRAACETTGNMWLKTFEAFEEYGIPIKLANTYKMKIISDTDIKTDPIDARKIANILRVDMIPQCYVAPPVLRDARELLRYRISMVQARTALINYTHGLLDKYDVKLHISNMYSKKAIILLSQTNLERPNDNMILKNCARRIAHITEEITNVETEIDKQAAVNDDARLLMSMTGLGVFGSMLVASEIGDISRFKTPEQLVSWAGMCPTVYQSGDKTYHGHMKKASNRRVNWVVIQAANVAVRHDDRLRIFYEKCKKRHGGKHVIAITHVANKMLRIIWKMLTLKEPYESRNAQLYGKKMKRMDNIQQSMRDVI